MFTIEDAPKFAGTQISVKSPGELSLYIKENEKPMFVIYKPDNIGTIKW